MAVFLRKLCDIGSITIGSYAQRSQALDAMACDLGHYVMERFEIDHKIDRMADTGWQENFRGEFIRTVSFWCDGYSVDRPFVVYEFREN